MKMTLVNDKILIESLEDDTSYENLYIQLRPVQRLILDHITRKIMKNRCKNKDNERITSSSILRCLLDVFLEIADEIDFSNIKNEKELFDSIKTIRLISYNHQKVSHG